MEFPTVTFCNSNPFTTRKAQSLIKNVSLNWLNTNIDTFNFLDSLQQMPTAIELTKMFAASHLYTDEMRKELGFSLINNAFQFSFNGQDLNKTQFHWYYSYDYGNCFQFNSGLDQENNVIQLKESLAEGEAHSLQVAVFIQNQNLYMIPSYSNGLKVFIHNHTFEPSSSEGVNIQPGTETNILIKRTFTSKEPQPYTECTDLDSFSSELYNFMIETNKTYRQIDCINLYLQRMIIENCKCFHTKFKNLFSLTQPCLNLSQYECMTKQFITHDHTLKCLEECPLECESVSYDLQSSSLEYPSIQYFNTFKRDTSFSILHQNQFNLNLSTYEQFKECFLAVNIFYPFLQYNKITIAPKLTVIDLISQIGGSLGMFLGFSLFHFVEVGEILFLTLFVWLAKTRSIQVAKN
jgi:hypothetical protein